ncbi:MAG TPA: hypothetical protein VFO76_08150 [Candidatus Kapabacteria bacterium]|nr:hypothetical protein [Candidatus Kapabacteria bacterium]
MQIKHSRILPLLYTAIVVLNSCNAVDPLISTAPIDSTILHTYSKITVSVTSLVENAGVYSQQNVFNSDIRLLSQWNDRSCTFYKTYKYDQYPTPPYFREDETHDQGTTSIFDSISTDNSITGSYIDNASSFAKNHWGMVYIDLITTRTISYSSIPIVINTPDSIVFSSTGQSLRSKVNSFEYSVRNQAYSYSVHDTLNNIDWDKATLTITLYK